MPQGLPAGPIAIVGAGAIGCRIAAHLAQHGVGVTLFDGWAEHVRALNERGLRFEATDGSRQTFATRAHHVDDPVDQRFELVLLATRSDATASVLPLLQRLLTERGCVVSCQNGVNEDAIASAVGAERTMGCSLVFGARLVAPGHVVALPGADQLRSGELSGGDSPRLRQLAALLALCGTSTVTFNLIGYRWMKLVLNATGNTLLLLTGLNAGALHEREDARRLVIGLATEILGTAVALGIEPEPVLGVPTAEWLSPQAASSPRLHEALLAHGRGLGGRRLSMVADFEARGRTEVDHINGYVARKANALGRSVPLNEAVWRLVREMEARTRQAGLHALDELCALQEARAAASAAPGG